LLYGEEVQNLFVGLLVCVGAVQLVDSHSIDGKLGPQTAAAATTCTDIKYHQSHVID